MVRLGGSAGDLAGVHAATIPLRLIDMERLVSVDPRTRVFEAGPPHHRVGADSVRAKLEPKK